MEHHIFTVQKMINSESWTFLYLYTKSLLCNPNIEGKDNIRRVYDFSQQKCAERMRMDN